MQHHIKILLQVLSAAWLAQTAMAAPPIDVYGQNDITVDRAAIQAAIDQAPPGGQVVLHGTFQLDGTAVLIRRGDLTIRGVTLDQDGDAAVNEDWSDGTDNDEDGLIDEDDWDAELVGLEGNNGFPAGNFLIPFFNHALQVTALTGTTEGLRIRDLSFSTFWIAVGFYPELAFDSRRCEDVTVTGGRLVGARIENSRFRDNFDGIELRGAVEEARLQGNLSIENNVRSVFMTGDSQRCIVDDSTSDFIPIARPSDNRIQENTFANVVMTEVDGTEILENALIQIRATPLVQRDVDGAVIKNNVIVARLAMTVFDSSNGVIKDNVLQDSTVIGIVVDGTANGFEIKGNQFERTSTLADILLGSDTSSNRVVVNPLDLVFDFGTDNEIVIDDD